MSSETKTTSNALGAETSRRRFAMQLGLGSVVLLLTACGGGGGSGLVEDESSDDDTARVRAAYDALRPGMNTRDVVNLVGRSPNNASGTTYTWDTKGGGLDVSFDGDVRVGLPVVTGADWYSAQERLSKGLL